MISKRQVAWTVSKSKLPKTGTIMFHFTIGVSGSLKSRHTPLLLINLIIQHPKSKPIQTFSRNQQTAFTFGSIIWP